MVPKAEVELTQPVSAQLSNLHQGPGLNTILEDSNFDATIEEEKKEADVSRGMPKLNEIEESGGLKSDAIEKNQLYYKLENPADRSTTEPNIRLEYDKINQINQIDNEFARSFMSKKSQGDKFTPEKPKNSSGSKSEHGGSSGEHTPSVRGSPDKRSEG